MGKDKTLKKGEIVQKVKNQRKQLVKMLKEEPGRLDFKTQGNYEIDFPQLKDLIHFDSTATNFMFCRICHAKKDFKQAFVFARHNNS